MGKLGKGTREVLGKLEALTSAPPTPEYNEEYTRQVATEQNHRGAVLLIGSNLESVLETALSRSFQPDRFKYLTGPAGAAGDFYKKIHLGFAMDIYGPVTFQNLEIVRGIRNAFAHAKIPISFDTPDVAEAVGLLDVRALFPEYMKREMVGLPPPVAPGAGAPAFEQFKNACTWIAHRLAVTYLIPSIGIEPGALRVPLPDGYRIVALRDPLP